MTPGARRVLEELAADEEIDLAAEGLMVYCGDRPTTHKVVNELLRLMAISVAYRDGFIGAKFTSYAINTTGRALVRRPEIEDELHVAIMKGRPFQIIDDRIVPLKDPVSPRRRTTDEARKREDRRRPRAPAPGRARPHKGRAHRND